MTNETKTLIISLRESGKSYGEIVLITGACESTVKTICLRYKKQNEDKNKCKYCSKKLKFIKGKKKKIFCSDNCRMLYWKENRNLIKRKPCFDVDVPWERISKAYILKAKLNKPIKKQNIWHGGSSHYNLTLENATKPDVSLNQENLMLLYNECHNKEHGRFEGSRDYSFDCEGI